MICTGTANGNGGTQSAKDPPNMLTNEASDRRIAETHAIVAIVKVLRVSPAFRSSLVLGAPLAVSLAHL